MEHKGNYAFIDGQNLHLWTLSDSPSWDIDFRKFRVYLREKYNVIEAFYFMWYVNEEHNELYKKIQKSGFIILFKNHTINMKTEKKWNVDSDVIFHIMKSLIDEKDDFEKIILVSGDGDYKNVVDYLIKKERFLKILFPNRKFSSSLYKKLWSEFYDDLSKSKAKLERIK